MVKITIGEIYKTAGLIKIRTYINNIQRARRCVTAKERALWAAQNLDALYVDKFAKCNAGTGLIRAVNKDTNSRFKPDIVRGRPHTANTQNHCTRRRLRLGGRETWRNACEVMNIYHTLLFKVFWQDRRHRDRNILNTFGAARRRHNNFIIKRLRLSRNAGDSNRAKGRGREEQGRFYGPRSKLKLCW